MRSGVSRMACMAADSLELKNEVSSSCILLSHFFSLVSPIGCWRDPLIVFSCIFLLVHWQFVFSFPWTGPESLLLVVASRDKIIVDNITAHTHNIYSLVQNVSFVVALDFDSVTGRVFWSDLQQGKTWSAFQNGTDQRVVSALPHWLLLTKRRSYAPLSWATHPMQEVCMSLTSVLWGCSPSLSMILISLPCDADSSRIFPKSGGEHNPPPSVCLIGWLFFFFSEFIWVICVVAKRGQEQMTDP